MNFRASEGIEELLKEIDEMPDGPPPKPGKPWKLSGCVAANSDVQVTPDPDTGRYIVTIDECPPLLTEVVEWLEPASSHVDLSRDGLRSLRDWINLQLGEKG